MQKKRCPKCKCKRIWTVKQYPSKLYWCQCASCQYKGLPAKRERKAVRLWNKDVKDMLEQVLSS